MRNFFWLSSHTWLRFLLFLVLLVLLLPTAYFAVLSKFPVGNLTRPRAVLHFPAGPANTELCSLLATKRAGRQGVDLAIFFTAFAPDTGCDGHRC